MAISHNVTSALATGTGTRNWSHAATGTVAGAIVVIVGGAVDETSDVTYGGAAMERRQTARNTSGESGTTSVWFLNHPATGTQTVEITRSGSTAYIANCHTVASATGYSQDLHAPDTNVFVSTSTNTAAVSMTLDSTANFICGGIYSGENALSSITANPANFSYAAGFGSEQDFGNFVGRLGRVTVIQTGATFNFTFTQSADDAAVACIAIQEAAVPPETTNVGWAGAGWW